MCQEQWITEIRNGKIEVIYISALNVFNHDLGMDFSS